MGISCAGVGGGTISLVTEDEDGLTARGLVNEKFTLAQGYADAAWKTSWDLIGDLQTLTYPIDWTPSTITDLDLMGLDGLGMDEPPDPGIDTEIDVAAVDFTGKYPNPVDVTIDTTPPPEQNIAGPGINIPGKPDDEFPTWDETAPGMPDIDYPTKDIPDLPPIPQLADISVPGPPDYNEIDFDGEEPRQDLTPPDPSFDYDEETYVSDVKTALEDKLLTDIINGGTGLNNATEQAIYDRAESRQESDNERMYTETLNFFESRGFMLPPGALAGALLETSHRINQTREDLNNDILIQQSKLAQENTHFIISSAIQHERDLMTLHNQVQQRAFETAKYIVEAAVLVYGIKVEAYKAQLECYKAKAMVYEARIRGEIAKAELYKARIDGVRAIVDLDKAVVDAYLGQVQGVTALVNLYKAEMEGAKIQADVGRALIDAYAAKVGAFRTEVEAITAKYDAYRAEIEGEKAKADMYKAQVDAYTSLVMAYKAKAEVEVERVRAFTEIQKGEVDVYRADVDKYKADVDAAIARAETQVKIEGLDVAVYEAQVKKYQAEVDATVRAFNAKVEELKAKVELEIKQTDVTVREALAKYEMTTESIRSSARVAAQLASAALAAVSASADISHRESRNDSTNESKSEVTSRSCNESVSEIHTFSGE